MLLPSPGRTQSPLADAQPDFRIAVLDVGGETQARLRGWSQLAWELRRRTSVATDLEVVIVDPQSETLFDHPFAVLQGSDAPLRFTPAQARQLRRYLQRGGFLLADYVGDDDPSRFGTNCAPS